jgi:hypothetical protein
MMLKKLPCGATSATKPGSVVVAAMALAAGLTLAACAVSSANSATPEPPPSAGLETASCASSSTTSADPVTSGESAEPSTPDDPATVEEIAGSQLKRVVLTQQAAERLNIKTTQVREQIVASQARTAVPYAAVIYDADGGTWVYTMPEPLTYVREQVTIEDVQADLGILSAGPPMGTVVVNEGAAMLYGTELGVGE